ncbi:DUF2283 domain-containing protein [Thermodesulfatator autotrophicus]|uniref:DUF2283 domain-containing protein n=1 Tax=Thermodesulfatator autotrophicus TaxID=1795632 RepID=UPI0008394FB2|nr:DUF2283 domain-containing protein [Thermodesulfatator autotrophicus]
MKIYYDREADAIYIKLSDKMKPDGTIEIEEGVNIDTTKEGKIVGIDASKKINLKTILSYTLIINNDDLDQVCSQHREKSAINTEVAGG